MSESVSLIDKLDAQILEYQKFRDMSGCLPEVILMHPYAFLLLKNEEWNKNNTHNLQVWQHFSQVKKDYKGIRVIRSEDIEENKFEIF